MSLFRKSFVSMHPEISTTPTLNLDFSPFPVLKTERLVLRRMTMEDAADMTELHSSPGARRYSRRAPRTEAEIKAVLEKIQGNIDTNTAISWAMTLHGSDKMIGDISFWRMMPEHFRAETGYLLGAEHCGKGLATEALRAVLGYGFEVMRLHSVEARVNPENMPSVRLLERCGFAREAYFRENEFFNGKFVDSAVYSLLNPKR